MDASDFPSVEVIDPPSPSVFDEEIRPAGRPVIMKGLASAWPAVRHASEGAAPLFDYLRSMDTGRPQQTIVKNNADRGRFFYSDDLQSRNFFTVDETVSTALNNLINPPDERIRYIQSIETAPHLSGFDAAHPNQLVDPSVPSRIWIGGQTTVQTHFDQSENIAICVLGEREFTLFPPEQLKNLYPGPLETAPAGVMMSLTDLEAPDFEAHPKFEEALKHAVSAKLELGDGIYIPYAWWHHVRATAPLNTLVNYWWRVDTTQVKNPFATMCHAMMVFHGLPDDQRQAWMNMFEYFVFQPDGRAMDHLPDELRGILGGIADDRKRASIMELIRGLSKEIGLTPKLPR